ncbi:MAG: tRNA (guanosine(46)-N7)-methyltransferase TrmB [Planctomycetes bacterium]|nr:tRNA (guanosine(46)-N7)-methyltransferase TrmB [Planctomycetota bacterium]
MSCPPDPRPFYKSLAPLLVWQALPRPADWGAIFGRRAPLTLEIGVGNGEFMARESTAHPERDHVGIEMRWSSIMRSLRNLEKAQSRNVRLVLDDAKTVLERLFAPRTLERAFVLFPCPWRKHQHERLRLFHHDFCELLNSRLVDGGEVLLVTDWTPYFEWTLAQLPGTGFAIEQRLTDPAFDTKYERKWRALGRTRFHEVRMRKQEHREVPVLEDHPVNPAHFKDCDLERLVLDDTLGGVTDGVLADVLGGVLGGVTITFKELVRDRVRQLVMIRTAIVEEPLTQMIWITVARDAKDGSWWVVPARGCQMIPTAGVQQALDHVAAAARATVTAPA